jgi:O-acetyl-ADP-ribose deacetylase (regulator of RNase III)
MKNLNTTHSNQRSAKITLFSRDQKLCERWSKDFIDEENVTICNTDYSELLPHDCLVSPANSYGIMSGGLDLLIRDELGVKVQDKIQWRIQKSYNGCQPVGTCIIIKTEATRFKFLAHSPTMQRPQNIQGTLNPMHSFFAALVEANKIPEIQNMACSGMGAGSGQVPPEEVSNQMYQAYKMFLERLIKIA